MRWIHANRLRPYLARANNAGVIFETDQEFGEVPIVPCGIGRSESANKVGEVSERLTGRQQRDLDRVLGNFSHVFSEEPGRCNVGAHTITLLPNAGCTRVHPYSVPIALREEVERQVTQLLEWGFIYPIDSPHAHPVVCVAKKDGSVRVCIDYMKLNAVTEPVSPWGT